MKKILSMVTALCCTASLISALPANAEEVTEDYFLFAGYLGYPFGQALIHCYMQNGYPMTEPVAFDSEKYSCFLLTADGTYTLEKENAVLKRLTLSENASLTDTKTPPEYKYLVITKAEVLNVITTDQECYEIGIYELADAEGNTYEYSQNFSAFQWQSSLLYAKEGDIYQFSMYHDIPVTVTGTRPSPDIEPFMVALGQKDGRVVGRYYETVRTGLTTCDLSESQLMYLPEDYPNPEKVQYGDIFSVGVDYGFTQANPSEIEWYDGGDVQKYGKASDSFTIEDLTVVSRSEKNQILTLQLKNNSGKEYTYIQDNSVSDLTYGFTGDFQEGDSVKFAVYGTTAFLPAEGLSNESESTLNGDADGSGTLDIIDIITVNKAFLGKELLPKERISSVDFNGNGIPDADDALTMLKMLVGLI